MRNKRKLAILTLIVTLPIWADVILQGVGGTKAEVDVNNKSLRVTLRPLDIGSQGSYSISGTTGAIAAGMAANGVIFQFRWTSGAAVALVKYVSVGAASGATGFAAGVASCGLVTARSYTVTGTTGSTAIATTGSEGKLRTSFGTTLVANGDIRISNTAACTGQTWTLDTSDSNRLGPFTVGVAVQTNFIPAGSLVWVRDTDEWPLVLAQNEGFAVRCTVPATGVWSAIVTAKWSEITTFP